MSNLLEDIRFKKHVDDLSEEYGKVMDWFSKDYPEGEIRLEVNSDQRIGALHYKLVVKTGREATPENQGLMTHTLSWTAKDFMNTKRVDTIKKQIFPGYKASITKAMNQFMQAERERTGLI